MTPSPPRTPGWLAGGYLGGGRWLGALFFVLFTLLVAGTVPKAGLKVKVTGFCVDLNGFLPILVDYF